MSETASTSQTKARKPVAAKGRANEAEAQRKAPAPDEFERAIAGYHDCVGAVIVDYERRLQQLNDEYVEAANAAAEEPTPAAQQRALAEANERHANGTAAIIAESDEAVERCFEQFGAGLKAAFAAAKKDSLTVQKLAEVASQTAFVAAAASGAFPAWWWRPTDVRG
jgi:hypothetical protein